MPAGARPKATEKLLDWGCRRRWNLKINCPDTDVRTAGRTVRPHPNFIMLPSTTPKPTCVNRFVSLYNSAVIFRHSDGMTEIGTTINLISYSFCYYNALSMFPWPLHGFTTGSLTATNLALSPDQWPCNDPARQLRGGSQVRAGRDNDNSKRRIYPNVSELVPLRCHKKSWRCFSTPVKSRNQLLHDWLVFVVCTSLCFRHRVVRIGQQLCSIFVPLDP